MLFNMFNKIFNLQGPCTLQGFVFNDDNQHHFAPLSPSNGHIAFQGQVVFHLNALPNTSGKVQLACPLPGCGSQFDNLESYLDHFLNCSWLPDAWRRCPDQISEKLTACAPSSDHHPRSSPSKKLLRLKRAISSFKHFGRKRSAEPRILAHNINATDYSRGTPEAYELPNSSQIAEIDSHTQVPEMAAPDKELARCRLAVPKMAADEQQNIVNVAVSNRGTSEHGYDPREYGSAQQLVTPEVAETPDSCRRMTVDPLRFSASNGLLKFLTNDTGQVGSINVIDPPNHSVSPSQIISPSHVLPDWSARSVSPISEENTEQGIMIRTALITNPEPRPDACIQGRDYRDQRVDDDLTLPNRYSDLSDLFPPTSCLSRSSALQIFTSAETLVEELRALIRGLNGLWISQLSSDFKSPLIEAKFHQQSIFETGLETLQEFYRGTLPSTFEGTFALMHVAFACAQKYNQNENSQFRDTMFQDALQWHNAIVTAQDRDLFLNVAYQIWSPPGWSTIMANHVDDSFLEKSKTQNFLPGVPPLWDILRKGAVISACTPFLDSIEYAGIRERNGAQITQSLRVVQDMEVIIDKIPLWKWEESVEYREIICETRLWVYQGTLFTPREVELKLAIDVCSSHIPRQIYNQYRSSVASLCDIVMSQSDSSWRNPYYVADVDKVLAVIIELQKKSHLTQPSVRHEPPVDDTLNFSDQQFESPLSAKSDHSSIFTRSSATTMTSSTFGGFSNSSSNNSNGKNTKPSVSPVELPSADPSSLQFPTSESSTSCDLCGTFFTGKPQDQKSNLQRHIRTVHEHSINVCPECGKGLTRSDNLLNHRRKFHGL